MDNIRILLNRLSKNLGTIKEMIKIENSTNDMSLNVLLETRLLEIYNYSMSLSLENANLFSKNFPGIDGIDKKNKIMVQVTSTFSTRKIEHTITQILENYLYKDYDRLVFICLSDKKTMNEVFKTSIKQKIGNKFKFDFESDIIDLNDIYKFHFNKQDIEKIHKVVGLLDEVLDYLPERKESGFDVLSVCFDDEELDNVYNLVNTIVREGGMNVYISSKKLYNKFKSENNPQRDYIIYADPSLSLENINFCITVLSNSFIYQNFSDNSKNKCHLFENAVRSDIKIETITFDRFISNIKMITDPRLRSYSSVTKNNLLKTVKNILSNRTKESVFSSISPEEIINELIETHKNFQPLEIDKNQDYILINFIMDQQEDLELNYIILSREYNLTRLVDHYNKNYKKKYFKNLNILVPKDFDQKTKRRLEIVKGAFSISKIYYIDEHLFDKRYKSIEQNPLLTTKEFITPVVRHDNEYLGINDIIHWIFNNSDSSVAIINGSGGIGKTTISEKIHDTIVEDHDRNIVIFIDAQQYIEVFRKKRIAQDIEYDLYNIFKACHPHSNIIDKNSFYLNYALGNIIIIFDGIDEIISTIPSFSLYQFIEKLENLRKKIGRGKILINCRDSYIKDLIKYYEYTDGDKMDKIKIYELLGFDEDLSKKYFQKHFKNEKEQKTCMNLLKEFYPEEINGNLYKYPPFILEIIIEIVTSGFDYNEIKVDFKSKILQPDEFNDVVIFRICNREIAKKEEYGFHLEVDKQIQFFCNLALEEKGKIDSNGFERILANIGLEDRLADIAKGLKDHPILIKTNGDYQFRFDFFNTYFKSIGVFNILSSESQFSITERLINVLSYECNFNSVLFKSLVTKMSKPSIEFESMILFLKTAIKKIKEFQFNEDSNFKYRIKKAISNILLVSIKSSRSQKITTSYLINEFFGTSISGKVFVSDFYFIDVPSTADIVLDFQGTIFTNVDINNYSLFFKCNFDEGTFFDENCTISNVYTNKVNLKNINAKLTNFDRNIKGDNSIFRILKIKDNGDEIIRFFKVYLKSFYHNRIFTRSKHIKEIMSTEDEFVSTQLLTEILEKNNIVSKLDNNEVYINERFESKIIKFITQAITFSELKNSIKELENLLLSAN